MNDKATKGDDADMAGKRKARLAAELRANLQKRKAQVRSRREGEADQRADGLAAAKGLESADVQETSEKRED